MLIFYLGFSEERPPSRHIVDCQQDKRPNTLKFFLNFKLIIIIIITLKNHNMNVCMHACMYLHVCMHACMLNKNTPGVKKSEAKSEAPCS